MLNLHKIERARGPHAAKRPTRCARSAFEDHIPDLFRPRKLPFWIRHCRVEYVKQKCVEKKKHQIMNHAEPVFTL